MNEYLTTAQVAELYQRHPVTVRRAAEAKELHGHQTGTRGRWSFRREAAEAWHLGRDSAAACGCARLRKVKRTA